LSGAETTDGLRSKNRCNSDLAEPPPGPQYWGSMSLEQECAIDRDRFG
jgi:hypothetical protein